MNVINDSKLSTVIPRDKTINLKTDDVYNVNIKEKLPNNEAILQINGQDVKVTVQGEMPASNRATVQIIDSNQSIPVVKVLTSSKQSIPSPTIDSRRPIQSEFPLSNDLKKAVGLILEKGISLDQESIKNIENFIEKATGTIEPKLETLTAMANKRLDFTSVQINAVHATLHSESLSHSLNDLIDEIKPDYKFNVEREVNPYSNKAEDNRLSDQNTDFLKAIEQLKKELSINPSKDSVISKEIEKALSQAEQLHRVGVDKLIQTIEKLQSMVKDPQKLAALNGIKKELLQGNDIKQIVEKLQSQFMKELSNSKDLKDIVKLDQISKNLLNQVIHNSRLPINSESNFPNISEMIKMIQKQPNINKVLETIKFQLLDASGLNDEQLEMIQQSINTAEQHANKGKEISARSELMGTFNQLENEIGASHKDIQGGSTDFQISDDLLEGIPLQSKDIIVTTITKKLSQAAIDFKEVKRNITQSLQTMLSLLDTFQQRSTSQVKPLLETTIKQLDNAILKSDFMLYTDMETEKKLMNASTKLSEAKKMLSNGDIGGASKIIAEVKNMMEKLIYKPSDVRVKHFVSNELLNIEKPSLNERLVHTMDQSIQEMKQAPSARHTLEFLRQMGLTYEAEQAHSIVTKGHSQEDLNHSMKNILMKLMESDAQENYSKSAENILQQLTGQQLLSKTDYNGLQSMMLTIPYLMKDQLENVKVYINSRNNSEKIDWENCSLYFLLETKKLGEFGILLTSQNRNLSFTLKNDRIGFKEKVEPLAEKAKERLTEMGYTIGNIQFTRLTSAEKNENTMPKQSERTKSSDRGYDFTI
ncbi:hypothetical protein ACQKP0_20470 [Heyndrickxia sp. NPDC080065]|uniref:hypothetical protein n=1 Tax=Heyndrickxia sp. NPDC080065 TaxID=3390568 RepID=UPI003D00E41A